MSSENIFDKIDDFYLLSIARKIYGPYYRPDGRAIVIVKKDDGTSRTISYPKFLVEERLGYELPIDSTIDHENYDVNDNSEKNLRIIPRAEHSKLDTRRVKLITLKCDHCGKDFERSPRLIRDKAQKGTRGNYCTRRCSGIANRMRQLGKLKNPKKVKPIASEYYRLKNVQALYLAIDEFYKLASE